MELLIAVQLTLLVIGMAYSSFLFARKLHVRWQQKTAAEQQYKLVNELFSTRLSHLSQINSANPYLLSGVTKKNRPITLQLHEPFLQSTSTAEDGIYATFSYLIRGKSTWVKEVLNARPGSSMPIVAVKVEGDLHAYGKVWPLRIVQRLVSREPIIR